MKSITIKRGCDRLKITAPEGKSMAINEGHLAHGVLSINEYGPSGIKIAVFSDWCEAVFDCEDAGYILTELDAF